MAHKFVRGFKETYELSHFLCMPIATAESRPQLEKSLHQFRTDPSTSKVPSGAHRPLQTLHLPIRALSLHTPGQIEAACRHLRSLDIDSLLRHTSRTTPETTDDVRGTPQERAAVHHQSSSLPFSKNSRSPSLTVTLSGVFGEHLRARGPFPDRGSLNYRLYTKYADYTSRIVPFVNEIKCSFDAAGFHIPTYRDQSYKSLVILLSTKHAWSRSKKLVEHHELPHRLRQTEPPLFETKEIIEKFENFVFAKDLKLEKLCLCEMGLVQMIKKIDTEAQLREVCSVDLP